MTLPRVHVQMDRRALGRGRVVVDGRPLPGVRAVDVRHEANRPPAVVVEFNAVEVTVEYLDALDLDEQEVSPHGTAK
ncbi:hypothetical protein QEP66_01055 [Streptomyces sp. LB8]|uniref:hypothetical protein n=1 Tax=Streptomyces sp. LB8 TaxID=3042509 RepID=UPI002649FBBE|nr:hypothetical protein [Streptomyces sp. LB8]MDN5380719.1 hypothetical protein [Streptomyces sp. LB8]